ncbi:DNA-directed RNA polymerase subunit alpha [Haliovirga abyssi]|uniref:DNA-directed RNA polymerase subunit alpha n=1 Tax=Haliovirga abyssi TaxID=2996794 RepID=A0AAU9DWE4_9FUSO|nr:DNA-directed RNA polymerase subunit alpha [Haliovirga abyssi]BDU49550.1 DNA-directed RNA polymerase subunit alpha [Haliovirga abyssi]
MLKIEKISKNITISEEKINEKSYVYTVEPLYRGYGNTLGNALRRVLLSSIPGAAIKGLKIDGVLNEFSTIEGVKEAVTDIILNIKEIVVKTEVPGERKMSLTVTGPKEITGADIICDPDLEIVNKDKVIATVTTDREINMEFLVDTGESFVVAEDIDNSNWEIGYIPVDAIYTPIRTISYRVEDTMVGRITNYDKLIMNIETDGSVKINDAISYAVELLENHLNPFLEIGNKMETFKEEQEEIAEEELKEQEKKEKEKEISNLKIDELDLTVRSYNCLKKAGIESLGELGGLGVSELLKIKNLGRKSLTEIMEKLKEYGFDVSTEA